MRIPCQTGVTDTMADKMSANRQKIPPRSVKNAAGQAFLCQISDNCQYDYFTNTFLPLWM